MHVYTLVWLKSDWIWFLIVGLKHLDYLIGSRITPACIRSIRSDWILRSAQTQEFFPGAMSRKKKDGDGGVFPPKLARKSPIVHLVCVIIMYTIYEMYKDVASSRSSYAIFLECRGSLLLLVT